MKKYIKIVSLVLVLVFSLILVGCSNDEKLIELEKAIGDYQTNIDELQEQIDSLNEQIEELEKNKDSQKSIIYAVRDSLQQAQKKLQDLEGTVNEIKMSITVDLVDEYTLVVGDNFQLFYRSVVQAPDPYGYYIKVEGQKGHTYNRYYEFCPKVEDIGTYTLKISVCDANGVVYGSDETKLNVVSNKVINNKSKNILCFGDSLTYNGVWVAQGISRYISAGGTKVNTLGTMKYTMGNVTVNYEGHSGWLWSTYVNDMTSPFVNSSGKLSFKDFCIKNGYSGIDEVYILLTWNGIGGRFREFNFNDSLFSSAKIIVDKIHEEYPNAQITLIGIPKPSTNAGLGAHYEINIANSDNYAQSVTVMNYNRFMEEWSKMKEYRSFLHYIDGMGQFDSEYNMPSEPKKVNNQNSTTEPVGNAMGIHPSTNGYKQIGDVFYRALMTEK